ncbi:MAG: hypothetical protein HKL80_01610 [Acidimicrobiales bacterium]|nr:hypothetical protein [Acidimicrobiales bacterium]
MSANKRVADWTSARAKWAHLTVILLVPTFMALGWWQLNRALSGNTLSWAYTFEWPIFAGYAIFLWWHIVHDDPTIYEPKNFEPEENQTPNKPSEDSDQDEEMDPELVAYNEYLAELAVNGREKRW